jgi:hypothetical protein
MIDIYDRSTDHFILVYFTQMSSINMQLNDKRSNENIYRQQIVSLIDIRLLDNHIQLDYIDESVKVAE